MDFSKFDQRAHAETGVFLALCDPYTKAPIGKGDDAPGFVIRGMAARSTQAKLAELQKAAKDSAGEEDAEAAMEMLHQRLIDSAMTYIIEARNIEIEGKPVSGESDIRRVLDMTFPDMQIVKDSDGNTVTTTTKDKDGKAITVPKFDLVNEPFAQQVIKNAENGARFFGKARNG